MGKLDEIKKFFESRGKKKKEGMVISDSMLDFALTVIRMDHNSGFLRGEEAYLEAEMLTQIVGEQDLDGLWEYLRTNPTNIGHFINLASEFLHATGMNRPLTLLDINQVLHYVMKINQKYMTETEVQPSILDLEGENLTQTKEG